MTIVFTPEIDSSLLNFSFGPRLPMILQSENADCGLACLAMLCGYHGFETDIQQLRQRYTISSHGTGLSNLIAISNSLKLVSRALRVEMSCIEDLSLPCIVHWDLNHFVVLKRIKKGRFEIHDPAKGARVLSSDEFGKHFTGVALETLPGVDFKKGKERRRVRLSSFWSTIVGLHGCLFQILLLSLVLQLAAIVSPIYMQTVVDDVVLRNDRDLLLALALGFAMLIFIEVGVSSLRQFITVSLSSRLNIQMGSNLFRHLIRLPVDFFQKRHVGDIVSRFGSVDEIRNLLSSGLVSSIVDGILVIVTLTVMFIYSVQLTVFVLAVVFIYILIRLMLFRPLRILTEESIFAGAKLDSSFLESVRAIQTIKLFEREAQRQNQWQNRLAEKINKDIRIARLRTFHGAANGLLFGLENIVVIYFAAVATMDNSISLGMFFAFMSFKGRLVESTEGLINNLFQLKMLGLHLDRLSDIVFTKPESVNDSKAVLGAKQVLRGAVEVKDLAYRYGTGETWAFGPINFSLEPGESLAITGPSGAGKTTLLKCIMGLLAASRGEVRCDGVPIQRIPSFRRNVASVMQDDLLLSGSIAQNISCFDHEEDFDRVVWAAQMACVHDEILRMPMQYNTLVGDMGMGISGGQRQRIQIARAMYRGGAILFMDEATSHMDQCNEDKINQNIAGLNITRIVVAHRSKSLRNCDRLLDISDLSGY